MNGNALEEFVADYCGDKTVYVSGPMSGMPCMNKVLFDAVESALYEAGCRNVVNPARLAEQGLRWSDAMRIDLRALLDASVMVQLPGWRDSVGARLEQKVADAVGIRTVEWGDIS